MQTLTSDPRRVIYRRPELLIDTSTHYCPGCGHGIIHRLVAELLDEMHLGPTTIGVASVGCSVFAYDYLAVDFVESPHGRAPAVATGVRRVRPDAFVFTYQGDGDLAAIGTAEIVHAAARGERISVIFVNNGIYGMTGGQMAPTTLLGPAHHVEPGRARGAAGRLPDPDHRDAGAAAGRDVRGSRLHRRSAADRPDQGDAAPGVRGPARGWRAVDRGGPLDLPRRLGHDADRGDGPRRP